MCIRDRLVSVQPVEMLGQQRKSSLMVSRIDAQGHHLGHERHMVGPVSYTHLLHTVLHCVFLPLYPGEGIDPDLWDLACDMVVE